ARHPVTCSRSKEPAILQLPARSPSVTRRRGRLLVTTSVRRAQTAPANTWLRAAAGVAARAPAATAAHAPYATETIAPVVSAARRSRPPTYYSAAAMAAVC